MLLLMPHININVSIGKFHSKKPLHKSQMNYPLPDLGLGHRLGPITDHLWCNSTVTLVLSNHKASLLSFACLQTAKMEVASLYKRVQGKNQCFKDIALKEKQTEALEQLLLGKDMIVQLPTGYGKSLVYILFGLLTEEVCMCIMI